VKIFRPLKILSLALMVGLGCDKPHEPCQKTLEILPLPAIFDVSKNDVTLGTVTVYKNGTLKLISSSEADSNAVAELERVVDRLSKSKVVNFTYSERAKDTLLLWWSNRPRNTSVCGRRAVEPLFFVL
jgi:hypothetical protein